jgi:hypothetical protein
MKTITRILYAVLAALALACLVLPQSMQAVITTANGVICVGNLAGTNHQTGDNDLYLGNPGVDGESGTVRIGTGDGFHTRMFVAGVRGVTTGRPDGIPLYIDSLGQLGTASSSRRFKKDIEPMGQSSETILTLKPVTFHYKTDKRATPQFGLIAEEVAQINPDLVVRDDEGEIYTVRYDAVNAMLLNEFLKEHRKVENQEVCITQLNSRGEKQEEIIAQQQKGMEVLTAQLEEQTAQIHKISAKIEISKCAPKVVVNAP